MRPCQDLKILAAKNSARTSVRFEVRSCGDSRPDSHQDLAAKNTLAEKLAILPRYQNVNKMSQCQHADPEIINLTLFSGHSAVKREQIIFTLETMKCRQESGIGILFIDS